MALLPIASVCQVCTDDSSNSWKYCWSGGTGSHLCTPGGSGTVTSGPTQTFINPSPSVDGNSALFGFTGTAFTDVLFYCEAGANNSVAAFTADYYVETTGSAIQDAEFDTYQYLHATLDLINWGTQCKTGGFWQLWEGDNSTWHDSSVSCGSLGSTMHHIILQVHRVPGDTSCAGHPLMYYDTLRIDGVLNTLNTSYCSKALPSNYVDQTGLNFQLDTNSSGGAISEYVDKLTFFPTPSQTCGPPLYPCTSTSTAIVQTPSVAPFSGTTGYNQIGYDTSLNPAGQNPYLRASDSTMLSGHSPNSTGSSGDNDEGWNCAFRTDTSVACSSPINNLYLLQIAEGGAGFVMGIQIVNDLPAVVAPLPASSGGSSSHPIPGVPSMSFSNQDPTVSFRLANNGTDPSIYKTIWAWDGTVGHSLTFTDSILVSLGTACPLPNGTSFNSSWTSPLSHDINDQIFGAALSNVHGIGSGVDTISVTNGSVNFTVSGPTTLATDTSLINALIIINNVTYTIATITSTTTGTLTATYAGTTGSGILMAIPGGQGTGHYVLNYNTTGPNCTVWDTYAGTTSCSGTGCPTTGAVDSGCHSMYVHDGFITRDGIYGHWSGATTGINCGFGVEFWQQGTIHTVNCTVLSASSGANVCGGHQGMGYHNIVYEKISPDQNYFDLNPANASSSTPLSSFAGTPNPTSGNCDDHFSWRNATSRDTQSVIGSNANPNFNTSNTTSTWTQPYQNENYALGLDGTVRRFGHNFILGPPHGAGCSNTSLGPFDNLFTAEFAIGTVSQDGRLWEWNSSMLGQLGLDVDSNTRADIFVIYLDGGNLISTISRFALEIL